MDARLEKLFLKIDAYDAYVEIRERYWDYEIAKTRSQRMWNMYARTARMQDERDNKIIEFFPGETTLFHWGRNTLKAFYRNT